MRKIILHFAITLDGIVSNVEQWVALDDEAIKDTGTYQDTLDAIIFGKNSYQPLVEYWTNAETASSSTAERLFAKSLNDMHKYVLSHGEVNLTWRNSELLRVKDGEAFKQAILQLKNSPGKDIWADAGEGVWRSFLEYDLWDGLDMLVHPLIIGHGKPLFDATSSKIPLRLVYSKTYANGVMNVRYERV
jgi:dihydrofolate reductase